MPRAKTVHDWVVGSLLALGAGGLMMAGADHISLGFHGFGCGLVAASYAVAVGVALLG